MEPEWVHGGNVKPILKQLATSQFWGLGLVRFDVEKVKKTEDSNIQEGLLKVRLKLVFENHS
uniref:Uncharacterized protein n=1 Tax=Romanomermis culicivorax TaxID=13658 RepID=A0A915HKL0_ROMCU